MEECGGAWRSVEERGGVWRSVEECPGRQMSPRSPHVCLRLGETLHYPAHFITFLLILLSLLFTISRLSSCIDQSISYQNFFFFFFLAFVVGFFSLVL